MREWLTAQEELSDDQCDEADHGEAAVEPFGALVKAPAALWTHDFHAWFFGKGIEATAFFCGH